jgi:hypothetical protein
MMQSENSYLTAAQKAELDALAAMPDDQINTTALPEQTDWSGARRGIFYTPRAEDR